MPYKDKDKQREAVRRATRLYRAKNKDSVVSDQKQVSQNAPRSHRMDERCDTRPVIPCDTPTEQQELSKVELSGVGDNDGFYEFTPSQPTKPLVRPEQPVSIRSSQGVTEAIASSPQKIKEMLQAKGYPHFKVIGGLTKAVKVEGKTWQQRKDEIILDVFKPSHPTGGLTKARQTSDKGFND